MLHSCPFPYYCPANSSTMKSCGGGSMPVDTSGLRGSKSSCCSVCEGGTYRLHHSPVPQCLPCPPGYSCPPGTSLATTNHSSYHVMCGTVVDKVWLYFNSTGTDYYKSHPCPFGSVCPVGSTEPVPCPPGSFGNLTQAGKMSDCYSCPAGTFNHLPAQSACFPCGSSSTSPTGETSSDVPR